MVKGDYIYGRVSGDDQTLAQQLGDIRAGMPISITDPIILDEVESGDSNDREKYNLLKRLIVAGKVRSLWAWSLDRLGRNAREVQTFVWLCLDNKVELHCVKEKIDFSSPFANILVSLIATMAEMELARIRERTRAKFRLYREQYGYHGHGSPPADDILTAKVMSKVASIWALHDGGMGYRRIASDLGLSVKAVQKVIRGGRLKKWMTRREWCEANPGWYKTPQDYGAPPSTRSEERRRKLANLQPQPKKK